MSILIKNMKMPKNCFYCPMREWHIIHGEKIISCRAAVMPIKDENDKPDWCPIIEVPSYHGRLIDADVLRKRAIQDLGFIPIWMLDEAPTIIKANEREDK